MPIDPLAPAPLATDPRAVFAAKAFARLVSEDLFVTQANALEENVNDMEVQAIAAASNAASSADAAASSVTNAEGAAEAAAAAAAAATNAANASGTSVTENTIPAAIAGSKSFVFAEADRAIYPGMYLECADAAAPSTNTITIQVTAWDAGTKTVTGDVVGWKGAGTKASWVISLTAKPASVADAAALTNTTFTNYTETTHAPAAGSAFAIDLSLGTNWVITTNANTTITLPAPLAGKSYTVDVIYGGAHTLTWAGGGTLRWPAATAPSATSLAGKRDSFGFKSADAANTHGSVIGINYAA